MTPSTNLRVPTQSCHRLSGRWHLGTLLVPGWQSPATPACGLTARRAEEPVPPVLAAAWCTLLFALPSCSAAERGCCMRAPDSEGQQLWRLRHFSSLLPSCGQTKRDQERAHPLLLLQQLKSEMCLSSSWQPLVNEDLPNSPQQLYRQALLPSPPRREIWGLVTLLWKSLRDDKKSSEIFSSGHLLCKTAGFSSVCSARLCFKGICK